MSDSPTGITAATAGPDAVPLASEVMRDAIASTAEQLREGERHGRRSGLRMTPTGVVFAGMGGSAMGGELLRALIADSAPVPMTRVRGYRIPKWAGPGTLVACVSYSGNTAETLSCAEQAREQGADVLAVTSGGKLARMAAESSFHLAEIPSGLPPRAALGFLFGALSGALAGCDLVPGGSVDKAAKGSAAVDVAETARVAETIADSIPVIYGAGPLGAVAYRWKTQMNENAKIHAFSHAIPELEHNEIEAWGVSARNPFAMVVLRDSKESARTAREIDAFSDIAGRGATAALTIRAEGRSRFERAFNLVTFGDWVSYHVALARGVDPMPIPAIQQLKSVLGR